MVNLSRSHSAWTTGTTTKSDRHTSTPRRCLPDSLYTERFPASIPSPMRNIEMAPGTDLAIEFLSNRENGCLHFSPRYDAETWVGDLMNAGHVGFIQRWG